MTPRVEVLQHGPWFTVGPVRRAEWVRVTLPLPHGPRQPVRLLHLSDLHLRRRLDPVIEEIVARVLAEEYDAILVTGDFVDDKFDARADLPLVAELIPRLRSRWGVFGIVGNHDGDLVRPWLAGLGVVCIEGRHVRVGEEDPVDLVGLPGVEREALSHFFDRDRDPAVPTVALSHYPDLSRRCGRLRPDVILAGHTHGGQISLPGRIPILTHDTLPRAMCNGVHCTENGCLIVSRGVGHTDLPVRLFAPPQVIELVLVRADG